MLLEATPLHAGRSALQLLDDDGRQVATIYATREGLHIVSTSPYELDGRGLSIETQQPTALHVTFGRRQNGAHQR
jgi:hypothetical protein